MEEKKPLFDRPMDELREAFVHARFAQADVFGRADVEVWLAGQQGAELPDYGLDVSGHAVYPTTRALAHRELWTRRSMLSALRECATAFNDPDHLGNEHPWKGDDLATARLVVARFGGAPRTNIYYGYHLGAVAAVDDDFYPGKNLALRIVRAESAGPTNTQLIMDDFDTDVSQSVAVGLDVLFAEWFFRRAKWEQARQYLCDAMRTAIAHERAKAEVDFDSAVAVSADGTKIVHADWVVVLGEARDGTQDLKFPASAFTERKILRAGSLRCCRGFFKEKVGRVTLDGSIEPTVDGFFRTGSIRPDLWDAERTGYRQITYHTRRTPPEQKLLELSDGRVFLTHRDQCPSPLPEGGVKVMV